MPRSFKHGERVKTPYGPATLTGTGYGKDGFLCHVLLVGGETRSVKFDDLEPLPRDIPREHVADLYLAVMRRCGQLMDGDRSNEDRARHADLAEVAECLRLLLEGEVRDGE